MSSQFSGGLPEFFTADRRSTTMNNPHNSQHQFSLRPPLSGFLPDPDTQIRRPEFIGKRSLSEFQQGLGIGFDYPRNVKSRPNCSPISPLSPVDLSPVPSNSTQVSSNSTFNSINRPQTFLVSNGSMNKGFGQVILAQKNLMNHRLLELEKELLGDDEEEDVSVVTNKEWSETIHNLIDPTRKPTSLSPTSSSSSSCLSTSASPPIPNAKQSLIDAATAISDGKSDVAAEILTRLQQVADIHGSAEQRLTAYMVSALNSRVNPTELPYMVSELYSKEHVLSTQMLYEVSPCFKLGFMAANLAILDATSEKGYEKIHVVDFDIGQGGQYVHLLHALAARKSENKKTSPALKITAFTNFGEEKLKIVGEGLKALAEKIGVRLSFCAKKNKEITDLSREKLGVESDEALAVNFAFKLHKLPDESVTTENLRDDLLRRVRSLSPTLMTVLEHEININTASLSTRVREACDHFSALFESLEATVACENPGRVRIEEALGRVMRNSIACEGRDRVERCEVFGKWRARMSMAGFRAVPMGQPVAELLRVKLNSGTRGNPGFSVNEQSGGICFGWMGRTLAVASAWR